MIKFAQTMSRYAGVMKKPTAKEYQHYNNNRRAVQLALSENRSPPVASVYGSPEQEWTERLCVQTQKCSKCRKDKFMAEYAFNTSGTDGFDKKGLRRLRPECRPCYGEAIKGKNKAMQIAKEAGIPSRPAEGLLCKLCSTKQATVFDHDHETNKFRGFLCGDCNRGLGLLGDKPELILRALIYVSNTN